MSGRIFSSTLGLVLNLLLIAGCSLFSKKPLILQKKPFGRLSDGRTAELFIIAHPDGSSLKLTNYGAAIVSLQLPDKNGRVEDVVLGFDTLEEYENIRGYYGAIVGRYANRIANGRFTLDDSTYQLTTNDGDNHLHGGLRGFDRVLWNVDSFKARDTAIVRFSYHSEDGEEGYPGNLKAVVTYSFDRDKTLRIDYEVSTDSPTIRNITNHSYFNLSGNLKDDILDHVLMINADTFLPVDKGLIPTGELKSVVGTPMDFRKPTRIGARINDKNQQLSHGLGYDHNWILNKDDKDLSFASSVLEPESGRYMEIYTTEPGIQFYSGNFMDGSHAGHSGKVHKYRHALALETQHYPDSPNHDHFQSTVIRPGEKYRSTSVFKFSIK